MRYRPAFSRPNMKRQLKTRMSLATVLTLGKVHGVPNVAL